jgi:hypothetical protein
MHWIHRPKPEKSKNKMLTKHLIGWTPTVPSTYLPFHNTKDIMIEWSIRTTVNSTKKNESPDGKLKGERPHPKRG